MPCTERCNKSWRWPDIEDVFERTLAQHGVTPETARFLARAIAAELCREVGGDRPYISKRTRPEEVRQAFDGRNHRELARLHGVSERTIRRWVGAA